MLRSGRGGAGGPSRKLTYSGWQEGFWRFCRDSAGFSGKQKILQPVFGVFAPVYGVFAPVYGVFAPVYGVFARVYGVFARVYGVFARVYGDMESLHAYMESLHAYMESLHAYMESLHAYMESLRVDTESLHVYMESLHVYMESLHVYMASLHVYTGSFLSSFQRYPKPAKRPTVESSRLSCNRTAFGRFADSEIFRVDDPGVPLRSTPGFMLSPAPQAGGQYRSLKILSPHPWPSVLLSARSRSVGHGAWPYHSLGEALHFLQLRAALQQ